MVAARKSRFRANTTVASSAAAAAIQLIKLSRGLPAVLAANMARHGAVLDHSMIAAHADAIDRFAAVAVSSLVIASDAVIPLATGIAARFVVFRDATGADQVAIIVGGPDFAKPVPVRLHSACLTGDVFGSRRCDCGDQLALALTRLKDLGGGVILYLAQEGRGLGLANKMRAYRLQDGGLDTLDANTMLGFSDDERDYGVCRAHAPNVDLSTDSIAHQQPRQVGWPYASGHRDLSSYPAGSAHQPSQQALPQRKGRAFWTPAF